MKTDEIRGKVLEVAHALSMLAIGGLDGINKFALRLAGTDGSHVRQHDDAEEIISEIESELPYALNTVYQEAEAVTNIANAVLDDLAINGRISEKTAARLARSSATVFDAADAREDLDCGLPGREVVYEWLENLGKAVSTVRDAVDAAAVAVRDESEKAA